MKDSDRKLLWARARGRCSICEADVAAIGEEAHIVARKKSGPRGDDDLPADQRDGYDNVILLCPSCHSMIDKDPQDWPKERLLVRKTEHEKRSAGPQGVSEVAGSVDVAASGADEATGLRVRKAARIKPGTQVRVTATDVKHVTGVEIGGSSDE